MNEHVISDSATTFYWLPLTIIDKQFLATAENALKSNDCKKIKSYCNFLQTIVFNDFPAEVFLQRSSILKTLVDLVIKSTVQGSQESSSNHLEDVSILKHLLSCIQFYTLNLKKRIDYIKDSSTFCYKEFYINDFELFSRSMINISRPKSNRSHSAPDSARSTRTSNKENVLNMSLYSASSSGLSSIKSLSIEETVSLSSSSNVNSFAKTNKKATLGSASAKSGGKHLKTSVSQPVLSTKKLKSVSNSQKSSNSPRSSLDEHQFNLLDQNNEENCLPKIDETIMNDLQDSIDAFLGETSLENYETDLNDKLQIRQSQEWPLHLFCFKLLNTLIDNMNLILMKNYNNYSNLKNAHNAAHNFQLKSSLLPPICETINNLVDILHETKDEWKRLNNNDMVASLFQKLNLHMKYSIIKMDELTENLSLNNLNRMIFIHFVLTFYKLAQLFDQTNISLPNDLAEIIFIIVNDICLMDSSKSLASFFSSILANLDKQLYEIYALSNEICDSMRCACDFLLKHDQTNNKNELIKMAKLSLNYMDYFVCTDLAAKIIEFCSKIMYLEKDEEANKTDVEYLVSSCLISKNDRIRAESYSCISRIVEHSLSVQVATEINSKRYKKLEFLLLSKVFYQFATFGLFDKCAQVKKSCENILLHLLQCELLVPESFRLRLTQLIVLYMPFLQCFSAQTDSLGKCILSMSSDLLTPANLTLNSVDDECLKLFLGPALERLRCSMRYFYSKDKNLRKKGYQQTIGFLTKHVANGGQKKTKNDELDLSDMDDMDFVSHGLNNENDAFDLNDFYLRFLPDKFADMFVALKRKNRTFLPNSCLNGGASSNHQSIFQADNLLRIYNIFACDTVDGDVKQNAGEQLAIMLSTGDQKLHKAFVNLDGVNHCLRYLKNKVLKSCTNDAQKPCMFLRGIDKKNLDKMQAACISCLSSVFYWNKEIRQLYLFDVEFYRLIFKLMLVCFNTQLKSQASSDFESQLHSNVQEDLSILLFLCLYHQVSSLENFNSENFGHKFDLSANLKEFILAPFNLNSSFQSDQGQLELKQLENQQLKAYDINYRLNFLLKQKVDQLGQEKTFNLDQLSSNWCFESKLRLILDRKFRLCWNFRWHGGSMLALCNDLFYNQNFVQTSEIENPAFSSLLCLNETDKFLAKFSSPLFIFKQLFNNLNTCQTHQEATNTLDTIQMLISLLENESKFGIDFFSSNMNEEFSLKVYLNHVKSDWHLNLNRFTTVMPSTKSKSDQILFSSSIKTLSKMLSLQMKLHAKLYLNQNQFKLVLNESTCKLNSNLDQSLMNSNNNQLAVLSGQMSKIPDAKSDHENVIANVSLDKWLFGLIYKPSSALVSFIRHLFNSYESDETNSSAYLLPLCDFLKVYYERMGQISENQILLDQLRMPSFELLKMCIEQIKACEIDKFKNLNKLAIVVNLIGSLLRVTQACGLFKQSNEIKENQNTFSPKICIQLTKSLVQIINTFNVGRGGLSLSFMGNFITKSAHVSLLQLVKSALACADSQTLYKTEICKAILCLKDQKNNLHGSSWLVPLMLHREPQIRSISVSLVALLINIPFARQKLQFNQPGIWSIALSILLDHTESSIVRTQACSLLVNMTHLISLNEDESEADEESESNISIACLQMLLHEHNFYPQIAYILSTFYPSEIYSYHSLATENNRKLSEREQEEELSICSPLLVSSICQLLFNLTVLLNRESILMVNNHGILNLLVSYVKPINLLTINSNSQNCTLSDSLILMLTMICKYLNLCCQLDSNCVLMLLKFKNADAQIHKLANNNLVYDLIECLSLSESNRLKLRPFYCVLFEILSTFLSFYNENNDRAIISDNCLIIISKCWLIISNFLIHDLLGNASEAIAHSDDENTSVSLFENALKFYSIYLAKLTQIMPANSSNSSMNNNLKILCDNISYLFDSIEINDANQTILNESCTNETDLPPSQNSLGSVLTRKLIKLFDNYFLVDVNANLKQIVANLMKGLFALSTTAKQVAVDCGLIETLIEHLKYTHSKLNLKSLGGCISISTSSSSLNKAPLKENLLVCDLQQTLLILKYLMCDSREIKEQVTKSGLHSIVHSFWCWAIQDQALLKAALSTLCTLTANNKLAINLMAQSNILAQTSNAINEPKALTSLSSTSSTSSLATFNFANSLSLLNTIIKTLQKSFCIQSQIKSSFAVQKYAFTLLTNCAQSSDCKSIIWKSNLLQDFAALDFQLNKFNLKCEKLWFNFLASLSFSSDGQLMLLKVEGLLNAIIKFLEHFYQQTVQQQQSHIDIQYLALLVLRNLAFNSSNKSKLVSNADYLNIIMQTLRSKNDKFQLLALSALDSLLYDYQKAKVILKNANLIKYLVDLSESHAKLLKSNGKNNNVYKMSSRIILIVNNLIKTLND